MDFALVVFLILILIINKPKPNQQYEEGYGEEKQDFGGEPLVTMANKGLDSVSKFQTASSYHSENADNISNLEGFFQPCPKDLTNSNMF